PAQALFCYFDGAPLGDPSRRHADPARQRFAMPFVFPSGRRCHSFDELALACLDNWNEAKTQLQHGVLAGFLAGLGRADLAQAAREASRFPDRDQGLNDLLTRLPTTVITLPKLVVEPAQVHLGEMRPGQDSRLMLHLSNQGMGLLHGTIS